LASDKFHLMFFIQNVEYLFVLCLLVASCCFWTTCILMSGDKSRLQTKVLKLCCRLVSLTCAHDIPRWENTILLLVAKQKLPIKTNCFKSSNYLILIRGLGCVTLWWNIDHSGATGQIFSVSPGSWKYPSQQYTTEIIFAPHTVQSKTRPKIISWAIFSL